MASEVIKLNLIPSGEMPTFHCSQFDNGREILIDLFNGEDEYSLPGGYTAELHTRKMDGNIVTLATTTVSSNHLTFTSTEQLTACAGNNLSEVSIKDASDYVVGTLNFWLYVEKDPLQGGLTSTSSIHDLTDQIEEITTEIVGENYYNKTETDDLLDLKADKSTTYTKTEVNTLLNSKADASSVYTKSQTDTLLSDKADKSDTYTKSQVDSKLSLKADKATTYTKTQVDDALALKANSADLATVATTGDYDDLLNKPSIPAAQVQSDYAQSDNTKVDYIKNKPDIEGMIADALLAVMPVGTAGPSAIASFDTALAAPLQSVIVNVEATGGNGTPDNPIPINGYTEANITRCGVNLFDIDTWLTNLGVSYTKTGDVYALASSSMIYNNPFIVANDDIPITLSAKLTNGTSTSIRVNLLDKNNTVVATLYENQTSVSGTASKIRFNWSTGGTFTVEKPQVECGSTPSAYSAYNSITHVIAFGQTVYGGVLDVTRGKLKPCIEYPSYNGETLSGRWLSSEATYIEGTTPPIGSQVVSLDDYGTDIDLTSKQIRALVGVNNVYSDTNGNTTVQFKDSIQHYIDTKVGS